MTYLDHNATTPVAPRVAEAVSRALTRQWGNPSSAHGPGREAKQALEHARQQVASFLHADAAQVCFTSGATEADNLAIRAIARATERRAFVCGRIEHPAVVEACRGLEGLGWEGRWLDPAPSGRMETAAIREVLDESVAFVAIMLANNETGVIQPVAEVASAAHEVGALVVCDAVQAAGKIPIDVEELGADYVVITAHKMYGPKGAGALWTRRSAPLSAQTVGGSQERGRRGGTENVPGAVGLGAACDLAASEMTEVSQRCAQLRDAMEAQLLDTIRGARVNGGDAPRLPNTSNILFSGVEGEGVALALDLEGFAVSAGSACHSGAAHPSAVLTSMGLPPEEALASVRISFGRSSSAEELEGLLGVLPSLVERLREAAVA